MPKVSPEHKDAVRRRLMDAALACLLRNEFRDVTTRELLAEAGLSTGTFYNYFPSKEHLYEALAEELLTGDIERIRANTGKGESTGLGLVRFLADYAMTDPEAAIAVAAFRGRMNVAGDAHEAISRLNKFVVDEFTPLVQKAQADGFVRDDLDAEAAVELLDIIWDGLGRREGAGTFQTSYKRVGATVLQVLVSGLLADQVDRTDVDLAPRPVVKDPRYKRTS
jgi:AcrR family transcriptional regulator